MNSGPQPVTFGRYYEEFEVGDVYRHWPGKTVTEHDHQLFCLLTMTHHPMHLDAHYAETSTKLKRPLVITSYLFSLLLGMSVCDITGRAISHRDQSLEHIAPVFHGDTVYGESTVTGKQEVAGRADRGLVQVETRGYKQDGTLFLRFRRHVVVQRKGYGEETPGFPDTGVRLDAEC